MLLLVLQFFRNVPTRVFADCCYLMPSFRSFISISTLECPLALCVHVYSCCVGSGSLLSPILKTAINLSFSASIGTHSIVRTCLFTNIFDYATYRTRLIQQVTHSIVFFCIFALFVCKFVYFTSFHVILLFLF